MSRRSIVGLIAAATLAGGLAAPALAVGEDSTPKRVCVVLTDDPANRGPAPLCVWLPYIDGQDVSARQ